MSSQDEIRETVYEPSAVPPLSDSDLAEALGGVVVTGGSGETVIKTASSSECGVRDNTMGVIYYRPCPRCNKPMHTDFYTPKWYCDPCNFSEFRPRKEIWNDTAEELSAAAS